MNKVTHLGWPSGIGLGPGSVLLLEVSGSIPSDANLGGPIYFLLLLQKKKLLSKVLHFFDGFCVIHFI